VKFHFDTPIWDISLKLFFFKEVDYIGEITKSVFKAWYCSSSDPLQLHPSNISLFNLANIKCVIFGNFPEITPANCSISFEDGYIVLEFPIELAKAMHRRLAPAIENVLKANDKRL
jgi:hypothetical protein